MKTHLMNTAVMPHAGSFSMEPLEMDIWVDAVRDAYDAGELVHHIGYENTLRLVEDLCGISLGKTTVQDIEMWDHDTFLVLRLRRSVAPGSKVRSAQREMHVSPDDFYYYRGIYHRQALSNSPIQRDLTEILGVTDTPDTDLSLNLANQRVIIIGKNGKPSVRKYTIYRARFQGQVLIGNIHRKDDNNQPWPEYEFKSETGNWIQRAASQKRDRDAAEMDPKTLRQRYARGETLNRAEKNQLFQEYPELEKVHRPPESKMSKEQRIHRAERRQENWEKLKERDE